MTEGDVLGRLECDGWAVVDLLDPSQVRAARTIYDEVGLPSDHDFYASPANAWGPVARDINRRLIDLVAGPAATLLPDHRAFMAGFTSKGARSERTILFHQDWTYTDERRWRAAFLWCPLVDVDAATGALSVVPRSHRWSDAIRPSREVEPTEPFQDRLAAMAVTVPLAAGQAVAFDPAVLHGSGPNLADRERPAFTMAFAPAAASLLHFHLEANGSLSGYRVDEAFFTEHPYRTRPVGRDPVDPWAPAMTADALAAALGAAPGRP